MKYKIGDKVKVKAHIEPHNSYNHLLFNEKMVEYCGTILTVTDVVCNRFYYVEENHWSWNDEMFEPQSVFEKFTSEVVFK